MKEVIYDYKEFCEKIDKEKPIHHNCQGRYVDTLQTVYQMQFKIYAVAKQGDHIILFEVDSNIDTQSIDFIKQFAKIGKGPGLQTLYTGLIEKYAKPLNSTEGRLEE